VADAGCRGPTLRGKLLSTAQEYVEAVLGSAAPQIFSAYIEGFLAAKHTVPRATSRN